MTRIAPAPSSGALRAPSRRRPERVLSPRMRRIVLTAHIVVSVGLLGEVTALLALAIRGATTADAALAGSTWDVLAILPLAFGIPLSVATLITGLTLALAGKWGVFRYPWVTIKLGLIVSVMAVGALVVGSSFEELRSGDTGAESRLIVAAAWDVAALLLATGLSIFKPGRRRPRVRPT